jgi:hypothetical protein
VILLSAATSAVAQAARATESVEPIFIEETLPNAPGDWDVRLSCTYLDGNDSHRTDCPLGQLFVGLGRRWGAELQVPLSFVRGERGGQGVGDVSTSVKYLLRMPGQRGPALALSLEGTFPSGSTTAGIGEGSTELRPAIAFYQTLGQTVVQGNVGHSFLVTKTSTEGRPETRYGAAVAHPIDSHWLALGECAGTLDRGPKEFVLSPGIKRSLGRERFFAVALPLGVTTSSPSFGVVLQLQFPIGGPREKD